MCGQTFSRIPTVTYWASNAAYPQTIAEPKIDFLTSNYSSTLPRSMAQDRVHTTDNRKTSVIAPCCLKGAYLANCIVPFNREGSPKIECPTCGDQYLKPRCRL